MRPFTCFRVSFSVKSLYRMQNAVDTIPPAPTPRTWKKGQLKHILSRRQYTECSMGVSWNSQGRDACLKNQPCTNILKFLSNNTVFDSGFESSDDIQAEATPCMQWPSRYFWTVFCECCSFGMGLNCSLHTWQPGTARKSVDSFCPSKRRVTHLPHATSFYSVCRPTSFCVQETIRTEQAVLQHSFLVMHVIFCL